MGTKRSFVEVIHDEGYGHDLVRHMNTALRGKDMIAQTAYDADEKGMQYKCPSCKIPIREAAQRSWRHAKKGGVELVSRLTRSIAT